MGRKCSCDSENPIQSETTNNVIPPTRTEEIENPETGGTIDIPAILISSLVIVSVILYFKKIKKEHV